MFFCHWDVQQSITPNVVRYLGKLMIRVFMAGLWAEFNSVSGTRGFQPSRQESILLLPGSMRSPNEVDLIRIFGVTVYNSDGGGLGGST